VAVSLVDMINEAFARQSDHNRWWDR